MAPSAPEEPVEECFKTFQHKLQEYTVQPKARSDWTPQPFVLTAKLTEWLVATVDGRQDSNIAILIDAVHKDCIKLPKPPDRKGGKKKCLLTFCILLELQQGHLLDCFLRSNIYDETLPLRLNHLEDKLQGALEHFAPNNTTNAPAHDLAVRFDKVQWKYFPVELGYGDENDFLRPRVFPFVDQQLITQKGGTAEVFEVAVPEAYVDKELMALSPTKTPHPDFPGLGPVCCD